MSPEQVKKFVHLFNTMINKPCIDIADEIFTPRFTAHVPMMPVLTCPGYKSFVQGFQSSFPDFRQEIHDTIASDNRIVLRLTYYGTQQGGFLGIPATGFEVSMPAISIFRIEDDLIVENWMEMDILGVIGQISKLSPLTSDGYLQSAN